MERAPPKAKGSKGDAAKEARIKAALKANLARRKAQAKARKPAADDPVPGQD